jgi:hypothetical protein
MKETQTEAEGCGCTGADCAPRPSMAQVLLWQAERAKMDLLREKVKKHLDAKRGVVYDQIAVALADHLVALAQRAAQDRVSMADLEARLRAIVEGRA